jgi:deazaflavin-dependent oxidoreductase (nitroreductase family)
MSTAGYVKPPWAARVIGARMARLFKPSVVSVLSVPGRRTGQRSTVSVAVLSHNGEEYLVSAYGNTDWSRNLRAAGTARLTRKRRTEEVTTEEVPVQDVQPLLDEYLRQFGQLPTVAKTFAALPNAADHPTFRITSTRSA